MQRDNSLRATLNYTADGGTVAEVYFYEPPPGTIVRPPGDDPKAEAMTEEVLALVAAQSRNTSIRWSTAFIECAMRHFFLRAEMGKNANRKKEEVDEDYKQAAALASLVAPYRHARLSAVKLAGEPNNPVRFKDFARPMTPRPVQHTPGVSCAC
jgi:hypothetical protein